MDSARRAGSPSSGSRIAKSTAFCPPCEHGIAHDEAVCKRRNPNPPYAEARCSQTCRYCIEDGLPPRECGKCGSTDLESPTLRRTTFVCRACGCRTGLTGHTATPEQVLERQDRSKDVEERRTAAMQSWLRMEDRAGQVWQVLRDREWHSALDICERTGLLRSQVSLGLANLRKRGFRIEKQHFTGKHGQRFARYCMPDPGIDMEAWYRDHANGTYIYSTRKLGKPEGSL